MRDYMSEMEGKKPLTNSKKSIKSGFSDRARMQIATDKLNKACDLVNEVIDMFDGTQFAANLETIIEDGLVSALVELDQDPERFKTHEGAPLTNAKKAIKSASENKVSVKTEEELRNYLSEGEIVFAAHTGPFGEDQGAEVVYFGDIDSPTAKRKIRVDDMELEECGCDSIEDYCSDFSGTDVIILNENIGQSDNNFYMLDARDVSDCELYVKK